MKALLLWPIMPNSFWSYQKTLDLAGLRSTNPPLGLITVAAMLPKDWEIRLSIAISVWRRRMTGRGVSW